MQEIFIDSTTDNSPGVERTTLMRQGLDNLLIFTTAQIFEGLDGRLNYLGVRPNGEIVPVGLPLRLQHGKGVVPDSAMVEVDQVPYDLVWIAEGLNNEGLADRIARGCRVKLAAEREGWLVPLRQAGVPDLSESFYIEQALACFAYFEQALVDRFGYGRELLLNPRNSGCFEAIFRLAAANVGEDRRETDSLALAITRGCDLARNIAIFDFRMRQQLIANTSQHDLSPLVVHPLAQRWITDERGFSFVCTLNGWVEGVEVRPIIVERNGRKECLLVRNLTHDEKGSEAEALTQFLLTGDGSFPEKNQRRWAGFISLAETIARELGGIPDMMSLDSGDMIETEDEGYCLTTLKGTGLVPISRPEDLQVWLMNHVETSPDCYSADGGLIERRVNGGIPFRFNPFALEDYGCFVKRG